MNFSTLVYNILLEAYFMNGIDNDGVRAYSVEPCLDQFRMRFPDYHYDDHCLRQKIRRPLERFQETGSVVKSKSSGRPPVTQDIVEDIRERIEDNPNISLRRLALQSNVPLSTCHKDVKKNLKMHAYKINVYQELKPQDFEARVNYCHRFQQTFDNDDLLDLTFYSDEVWFMLSGYVNSQNFHMWSTDNPHAYLEALLHPQKIGIWYYFLIIPLMDKGIENKFYKISYSNSMKMKRIMVGSNMTEQQHMQLKKI
jgi:hypothetical protein